MELCMGHAEDCDEVITPEELGQWANGNPDIVRAFATLIGDDYEGYYHTWIGDYGVDLFRKDEAKMVFQTYVESSGEPIEIAVPAV